MILDGEKQIEIETAFLGQKITVSNKAKKWVDRRIAFSWNKFYSLKLPLRLKGKILIMNSCDSPTLTCGA